MKLEQQITHSTKKLFDHYNNNINLQSIEKYSKHKLYYVISKKIIKLQNRIEKIKNFIEKHDDIISIDNLILILKLLIVGYLQFIFILESNFEFIECMEMFLEI